MYRNLLFLLVSCGIVAACGAPKEATDPSTLLDDGDSHVGGVENSGAPSPKPDATPARREQPPEALATRAECEAATHHLEELGVQLAIDAEKNEKKRAKLEAHKSEALADPEVKARVEKGTSDCLARRTSQKEARCIAGVHSEDEIDHCVGGGG